MRAFFYLLVSIAACSSLANGQGIPVPKKFENASPEIRAAMGLPPLATAQPETVDLEELRAFAGRDATRCAAVKVSAPVQFRGRNLKEIPDITEPQLRLANQLMSHGCYVRAIDNVEAITAKDPGNRNAKYVSARLSWMLKGTPVAEKLLQQTIAQHPDFSSAKVLLAGVRFEQQKLAEVVALLDEVEPRSPTDLWVYMNRLRVEGLRSPSRDLRVRSLEIVRNPAFPPNARESAAEIARMLPNQSAAEFEEVLRARLDIDSGVGTECKASELAFWLEGEDRFADVIKLLESPRARQSDCLGLRENRTMLAQAYLMEAAQLGARPGPANQHWLDKANRLLEGDFTSVAAHAQARPQYAKLKPFLDEYVHPEEQDAHGVTKLCHAISQLDAAVVRSELEAGADPKGRCRNESLVGSLVFMATVEQDEARREVMRALLEHGAPVTNIDACRSRNSGGDCADVLLPLMEKYSRK